MRILSRDRRPREQKIGFVFTTTKIISVLLGDKITDIGNEIGS